MRYRPPLDLVLVVAGILTLGCGGKQPSRPPEPLGDAFPPAPVTVDSTAQRTGTDSPSSGDADRASVLAQRIHFDYDRWSLSADARAILDAKAALLRAEPQMLVRVEGHADERGSDEYNLVLSQKRAVEAKRYLVQLGIDASRIVATGLGEEYPLATGETEAAWAMNRRAEFRITVRAP